MDMVRMKRCQSPPASAGAGDRVLRDVRIELVCINLGESVLSWAEKFLKNLHLPHLLHPSKLGETRLSFERRCTFGNSFLHRFCTFCTRRGRLRDELDAPEQPASVGVVRVDSEDLATCVLLVYVWAVCHLKSATLGVLMYCQWRV